MWVTRDEAASECKKAGGILPEPKTAAEQDALVKFLADRSEIK
jgi:hypothetical protein